MPDAEPRLPLHDEPTTDGCLLAAVRDWRDDRAWERLVGRYDSMVRGCCRMTGVRGADLDDVVQEIWLRLAGRIQAFRYDPNRRFRGWLRRMAANAAVDFHRSRRRAAPEVPLDRIPAAVVPEVGRGPDAGPLVERGRRIEESVKARSHETSWAAFRRCAIDGEPIADVARELDMQYAAVYQAVARIRRKLEAAGRAELAEVGGVGLG